MPRGHKFICLIDFNFDQEGMFDSATEKQIRWVDEACMVCITLPHPKLEDNVVQLQDPTDRNHYYPYVRDVDGLLWNVERALSKDDIINLFEQRD